jgi:hypothetical protein
MTHMDNSGSVKLISLYRKRAIQSLALNHMLTPNQVHSGQGDAIPANRRAGVATREVSARTTQSSSHCPAAQRVE